MEALGGGMGRRVARGGEAVFGCCRMVPDGAMGGVVDGGAPKAHPMA